MFWGNIFTGFEGHLVQWTDYNNLLMINFIYANCKWIVFHNDQYNFVKLFVGQFKKKCNLFTHETLRSKTCSCTPDLIGIWKCWFLRRGENRSTRRKTSRSKDENQQQTHIWHHMTPQPTYVTTTWSRTRATLVGGEPPRHCAIPAPIVGGFRLEYGHMLHWIKNQFYSADKRQGVFPSCIFGGGINQLQGMEFHKLRKVKYNYVLS